MSRELALRALHLEPTDTIPHTEYLDHHAYIEKVASLPYTNEEALGAVWTALDLDFRFYTAKPDLEGPFTSMGMAQYGSKGIRDKHIHCPFADVEEALSFDPVKAYGICDIEQQARIYQDTYDQLRRRFPTAVVPGGIYRSMVSFCIDTFGWDMLLLAMGTDAVRFGRIMEGFAEIILAHVKAWARVDIDCWLTHDDMVWTSGPFAQPEWYRQNIFPYFAEYWKIMHRAGKKVLFCSDGTYTMFVDDLAAAGADGFIFEPTTDLELICEEYGQTHVIIGNADCRIATFEDHAAIARETDRCLAAGRNCPGYFFAWGNHLPDNIPLENVEFAMSYFEKNRCRSIT